CPDRELQDPNLEQLRDEEVPGLVRRDQDQEHAGDPDHVEEVAHEPAWHQAFSLPEICSASAPSEATNERAQRSASRMCSSVSPPPRNAASALSTVGMIALKGSLPSRKALTASSLAAFKTAGLPPPARAASRASRTAGKRASSRVWNSSPLSSSSGVGGTAP